MNVCVSRRLKEELSWAIDKRLQLIINTVLFKTVIPVRIFYYIKLKSRLSVCLSDRHAGISAMSASIETGLARNES